MSSTDALEIPEAQGVLTPRKLETLLHRESLTRTVNPKTNQLVPYATTCTHGGIHPWPICDTSTCNPNQDVLYKIMRERLCETGQWNYHVRYLREHMTEDGDWQLRLLKHFWWHPEINNSIKGSVWGKQLQPNQAIRANYYSLFSGHPSHVRMYEAKLLYFLNEMGPKRFQTDENRDFFAYRDPNVLLYHTLQVIMEGTKMWCKLDIDEFYLGVLRETEYCAQQVLRWPDKMCLSSLRTWLQQEMPEIFLIPITDQYLINLLCTDQCADATNYGEVDQLRCRQ